MNKHELLNNLDKIKEESKKFEIVFYDNYEKLSEDIKKLEMIIPVIGGFSAGKSTFINSFLNRNILATAITPETALAAELRYSEDEYINAYKNENDFDRYNIDDIKEITSRADKYEYLMVYVNSNKLKNIEPLILVDMPGFNSPLDSHNKAIARYINKGVHYMVLTSVEAGTIDQSTINKLIPILGYNKTFDLFLTKCNLVLPDKIEEIKETVKEVVYQELGLEKKVYLLYDKGNDNVENLMKSIKIDDIYLNIFRENILSLNERLIKELQRRQRFFRNEFDIDQENIKDLERKIKGLDEIKIKTKDEMSAVLITKIQNEIIEKINNDIEDEKDDLAQIFINFGEEAFKNRINEIFQDAIILQTKDSLDNVASEISDRIYFNLDFKNSDLTLNISDIVSKNLVSMLRSGTDKLTELKDGLTTILSMGAILTNVISPLLEVAIIAIPHIISKFSEEKAKEKKLELVKNKIDLELLPSLEKNIKKKIPHILKDSVNAIMNKAIDEYDEKIKENKEELEKLLKEKNPELSKKKIEELIEFEIKINEFNEKIGEYYEC